MNRRYTAKELSLMSLKAMWNHVEEEGLDVHCSKNNRQITKRSMVKRILACYAARDVDRIAAGGGLETTAGEVLPENPEFEKLTTRRSALDDVQTEGAENTTGQPSNRGGWRPGAGRPRGMTEEKALYNRLSEQPHPAVKQMFELLFDAWATKTQCPGVRLTEQEARDIATPWTNVLELMGVADRIPNWIVVAIACGWNTLSIVKAKAALARQVQVARKEGTDGVRGTGESDQSPVAAAAGD